MKPDDERDGKLFVRCASEWAVAASFRDKIMREHDVEMFSEQDKLRVEELVLDRTRFVQEYPLDDKVLLRPEVHADGRRASHPLGPMPRLDLPISPELRKFFGIRNVSTRTAIERHDISKLSRAFQALCKASASNRDNLSTLREKLRLSAVLSKMYSPRTYERVFAEQFADMQAEYEESVTEGRKCHARWVLIRGYLIVVKVIAEHAFSSTVGKWIREIVK